MPTSPEAIERFLGRPSEPVLEVRGRDPSYLRNLIFQRTGVQFQPKTEWTGSERDQRQLEAITLATLKERLLLYYAVRTGKTKISLDWLQHLKRSKLINKALIIPHAPVGVDEWERQAPIHSDLDLAFIRSGSNSIEEFVTALENDQDGAVMTWSTLQQIFAVKRASKKGAQKLYADRSSLRDAAACFQALVVDEIHRANDPYSLRFDIISELAPESTDNLRWRLGLTGTPFARDPFGLWSQARIVDGGEALSRSFFFFKEVFGKSVYNHFSRFKQEQIFDKDRMPTLRAKLQGRMLTCQLEDIQDVNVIASVINLKMKPEQKKAYKTIIKEIIAKQEDQTFEMQNSFVRLRQISSGIQVFTDADGNRREMEIASTKHEWLEDFLTDLDPALKVVIFHEFVPTGRRICRVLEKMKIKHEWLWGGSKNKQKNVQEFQQGKAQVLVSNHGTGGTGIDLSAAHYLCVFESPVSAIGRQQMQARPLARGSAPLVLDDLICSPVERNILGFHAEGKSLVDLFQRPREFLKAVKL